MRLPWESVQTTDGGDEAVISFHKGESHPQESAFTLWECISLVEVTGSCLKPWDWRHQVSERVSN